MNQMGEVAKALGLQMYERFKIKGDANIYRFQQDGLCKLVGDYFYFTTNGILTGLLTGEFKIKETPFKPKYNKKYYCVYYDTHNKDWCVAHGKWNNDLVNLNNYYIGNCFETEMEALQNVDTIKNRLEKGISEEN